MAEEADITRLVEEARVVQVIHRIGVVVAAVGSDIVALAGGADIAVDDNLAVDRNLDAVTLNADLLGVPARARRYAWRG